MKKERQTNAILALLTKDGLSIDEILTRLDFPIEKRTLQRGLKDLKDSNQILVSGEARARRYSPKEQQT
ncbi:hypothetical protein SAMN02927921_00530 [Sinomicrobium oceani]|uniref:Uncharacterized protein n=1 Tax=Sinomicrobium oceani TaxID=1150368 RepID=A0A1K1MB30_9FLAO|nr:hypothetical protein [Sinomicrobium oceani]SFW20362.1 hypothetical protein SAMN02927921_00530 [Sinomicrobium oceani]